MLRLRPSRLLTLVLTVLAVNARAEEPAQPEMWQVGDEVKIFDGKSLEGWRIIEKFDFADHGKCEVVDGVIRLPKGDPATGISWKEDNLPRNNYELTLQGRRTEGSDFFCGLTFPVKEEYCSLILGGWGGQMVGLSNIDGFSAIENETTRVIEFENNRWYDIRLRVTDTHIQIWIDKEQIINLEKRQRKFSIWWEQEPVTPLGLVTWRCSGELKDLKLNHLVKAKPDSEIKATSESNDAP